MKRRFVGATVLAAGFAVALVGMTYAQHGHMMDRDGSMHGSMMSDSSDWWCGWDAGCAVGSDPGMWQGNMKMHNQVMNMMHGMGMTDSMMHHNAMMMHTQLNTNDPASILAIRGPLNLTDEQVSKLQAIVSKAQQDAAGVLTDEQRAKLDQLPQGPTTMYQMWHHMDQSMQKWHESHMDDPVLCPFHMMTAYDDSGKTEN